MSPGELNRSDTPPFHLKLFYRTGAYHRPDEFSIPSSLPPYLTLHTWPTCTLTELAHHLLDASPPILPSPAIGTRLCFRLIYADTRADNSHNTTAPPRYVAKDLGSVVLGKGGPGAGPDEGVPEDEADDGVTMTLADARFITGDFISCAILPPDELTGDVMPASSARTGRGAGVGEARGHVGASLPPSGRHRDHGPPSGFRDLRWSRGRGGGGGRGYSGGGRHRDWDESFGRGGGGSGGVPEGEWRRGDRLPDDGPRGGRWPR